MPVQTSFCIERVNNDWKARFGLTVLEVITEAPEESSPWLRTASYADKQLTIVNPEHLRGCSIKQGNTIPCDGPAGPITEALLLKINVLDGNTSPLPKGWVVLTPKG